ncbi:MAG: aspartate kinase [Acidobacteriaceae bacterium]|nr:aspartate kinase [Acidobacteriaceae bacterium]
MIIMKFGGSSVGSSAAIRRVASIVQSQVDRRPVVVVSAFDTTTDQLSNILAHASRGEAYMVSKWINELREFHFCIAEDLLSPATLQPIDLYIRTTFRDLHVRMSEVCEGERTPTPALKDWTLSLGEQLSSCIIAAVFNDLGMATSHLDSKKLILTDDQFTHAVPRYWETYANFRWAVAGVPKHSAIVLGGFIGATEDGDPTTLGRGGSDLTATIAGAALNAEEIQIWKDVDGMLTCDPKIRKGGFLLKSLSYREAGELAKAGAKILHPDTVAPAERLHIPIVLRNTFRPDSRGTSITVNGTHCSNAVKSIACKNGITLLEIRSPRPELPLIDSLPALREMFEQERSAHFLGMSADAIYLAVDNLANHEQQRLASSSCIEVHIRTAQSIVTLVGEGISNGSNVHRRIAALVADAPVVVLPQEKGSCSLRIVVPSRDLFTHLDALHNAFFSEIDSRVFAESFATSIEPIRQRVMTATSTTSLQPDAAVSASNRYAFSR